MLNNKGDLVLVDFGASKKFEGDNDIVKGNTGTMRFFAPEIVRTGVPNKILHGRELDIWASGVTIFVLAAK